MEKAWHDVFRSPLGEREFWGYHPFQACSNTPVCGKCAWAEDDPIHTAKVKDEPQT